METLLDAVQWPAMIATLVAAWLVASQSKSRRNWGFWWFIASNLLWAGAIRHHCSTGRCA